MSGYRTLHRIQPTAQSPSPSPSPSDEPDGATFPPTPIWRVKFSPCLYHDHHHQPNRAPSSPPPPEPSLRLLAAGGTNVVRAYSLRDNTEKDLHSDDVLDASAVTASLEECLVPRGYDDAAADDDDVDPPDAPLRRRPLDRGYSSLDAASIRIKNDDASSEIEIEIIAASQLGGRVSVWVRGDDRVEQTAATDDPSPKRVRPRVEFRVPGATGTTLEIRPPSLGRHGNSSRSETDVLVALGCADGSVALCATGIAAGGIGSSSSTGGRVVGDTSSHSKRSSSSVQILSGSTPGDVVASVGGGHACVMSLDFHPTVPDTLAVGRKDGTVDIYSSYGNGDDADDGYNYNYNYSYSNAGGNARGNHRRDGNINFAFRRVHHLVPSQHPIRALTYSRPDGALLFAGDDDGKLYSFDASLASSAFSSTAEPPSRSQARAAIAAPVKLVACALAAHRGWVMDMAPFPDGRRFATCGSDGSVKVWDCGRGLGSSVQPYIFTWELFVMRTDDALETRVSFLNGNSPHFLKFRSLSLIVIN
ncbi:hypothetical protein ACHAXS_012811 [Conticribra weissflogii]